MPTLLEQADIAKAPNFIARVQQGLVQVANEVLAAVPATPSDLDVQRATLARRILVNPLGLAPLMAQTVVLNENIGNPGPENTGADQENEAGDGALLYILREEYNDYLNTA